MRRLRPHPTTITSAGFKFLALSVIAGPAGFAFAMPELLILAIFPPLLMAIRWLWWIVNRRHLQLRRTVPSHATVGDEVEGFAEVSARRRGAGVLQLSGGLGSEEIEPLFLGPIVPGRPELVRIAVTPRSRGLMGWGVSELIQVDPVGLLAKRRAIDPDRFTLIRPRTYRLRMPAEGRGAGEAAESSPLQAPTQLQEELAGLRQYQPGDDLRHVHWAAVARTGSLIMRQFEHGEDHRVLLRIDDRAQIHTHETFERMVESAASVAVAAVRSTMDVTVEYWSTLDRDVLSDPTDLGGFLDRLALLAPAENSAGPDSADQRWRNTNANPERVALLVACGTWASEPATTLVAGNSPGLHKILVACDTPSSTQFGTGPLDEAGGRSISAGAFGLVTIAFSDAESFVADWNGAIGALP
jgi:hypothetical protein